MKVPLASSPDEVFDNIVRFQKEMRDDTELQAHASYFRAWYGFERDDGTWIFGPSKFIGYTGMTAPIYLAAAKNLNGRATEAHLQRWFDVVSPGAPKYDAANAALYAYLGRYGKAPSTLTRINLIADDRAGDMRTEASSADLLVSLLIEVARDLPARSLVRLRRAIDQM